MTNHPDATWIRAEDNQLRAAAASGETIVAISKRLCRSEKAVRHRAGKLGIGFAHQRKNRFGSSLSRVVELGLKAKAR
jgi:hypothetical protein